MTPAQGVQVGIIAVYIDIEKQRLRAEHPEMTADEIDAIIKNTLDEIANEGIGR